MSNRVLVIGGAGVFGANLCRALAAEAGVIVAGRDLGRAQDLAASIGATAVRLDRDAPDFAAALSALAPRVVVDAAGPFQGYGDDPYRVAKAAIAAGADYLDLSDDAEFTAGIATLDTEAKAKGHVVLSGVSSVPALSAAAVRDLSQGLTDIHLIESVILPGNRAPRGLSVIRAILAQAGRPLNIWQAGQAKPRPGWSGLARITLSPDVKNRWSSLIGAPDLTLFPARFNARNVRFRAGLELSIMHLGLWAMALPVRWGMARTITPLARPLHWAACRLLPFGTDCGGMRVRVAGVGPDGPVQRDWTLVAGAGDGPQIPAIPSTVLTRALIAGTIPCGARPCLDDLLLADACAAMAPFAITTQRNDTPLQPVFAAILATDYPNLPDALKDLHLVLDNRRFQGRATITRGASPLSRLAGWLMRFPPASPDTPVEVTMTRHATTETWVRDFGGHRFRSHLSRAKGGLRERFGVLSFDIDLMLRGKALHYPVTKGRAFGLPIPRWFLPRSDTTETIDAQGRATFDVALSHPLTGLIVRYRGWLTSADDPKA